MFTCLSALVVFAAGVTCVTSQNIKQNSPTYVPNQCFLDKAQGACRDYTRNYFFNVSAGYCQAFVYGGCGGNWNRFNTLSACHRTCTCATPPETGPCRGHIRRWFYSPADKCCRPFIYGGCGGNSNSYGTWTECSELCGYPTADSSWWTWGAQWGNWSDRQTAGSQSKNTSYSRNDFMRDWMLWALLAGGEFEMEDLAAMIGRAHVLGLGRSKGKGGAGGAGQFGLGSQMLDQESANGFFGAGFGGNMQSSGMANWGPAYNTAGQGSFTPLGHIGSIANMMNGEAGEWMSGGAELFNQLASSGFLGGANRWGAGNQRSFGQGAGGQGQGWLGTTGASLSGQGMWDSSLQGQGMKNQGSSGSTGWAEGNLMNAHGTENQAGVRSSDFINMGSGALGYMGPRQSVNWNNEQTGTAGTGNTAIEILHLISQIGRGALQPSDLFSLGQRYGAVDPNGNVDVNLLATRMVAALQGPRGAMNMARLKGVAQRLGALDNNGNINIPLMIKGMTETLSRRRLQDAGLPSLDEFNWLGSRKGLVDSSKRGPASGVGVGGGMDFGRAGQGTGQSRGGVGRGSGTGLGGASVGGGTGASGSSGVGSQGSRGFGSGTSATRIQGSVEIAAGGGGARMGSYGKK